MENRTENTAENTAENKTENKTENTTESATENTTEAATAIKNIIFDLGSVLIRFDRQTFLDRHAADCTPAERTLLERETYLSAEWIMQDRGTHVPAETAQIVCGRVPEKLHAAVRGLVCRWYDDILPIEGMSGLVGELKENGYKIFLLSNAAKDFPEYWDRIPGHEYFDDWCVSAFEGFIKPQPEIYRRALDKFGILASQSLFIDDVTANIEGALNAGMQGIVFHDDPQELREKLHKAGVRISV